MTLLKLVVAIGLWYFTAAAWVLVLVILGNSTDNDEKFRLPPGYLRQSSVATEGCCGSTTKQI